MQFTLQLYADSSLPKNLAV